MRRRDRPRTWGLWGDFTPIADRDMRIEVDERVLADGTVRASRRPGARSGTRARALARQGRRRRWRSSSSTPTPIPPTSARRRRRRAPSGRTRMSSRLVAKSCRRFGSSSAPRPPRSTPICNPSSAPTWKSSARRAGARRFRRRVPYRAVQRRRHVDRDGAPAAGAHGAVGPRRGRHRRRARSPAPAGYRRRHHRRSRRHVVRRFADRRAAPRRSPRRRRSTSASSFARR